MRQELLGPIHSGQALDSTEMVLGHLMCPAGLAHLSLQPPSQAEEPLSTALMKGRGAASQSSTVLTFFHGGLAVVCDVLWWKEQGLWRHCEKSVEIPGLNFGLAPC